MSKQDRQGVRTASDLERKYEFGSIGEQSKQINNQNLAVSQLSQVLSQFMTTTNAELAELKKQISEQDVSIEDAYPVDSIYISVNNTNPGVVFGFGVWEQIKDRFLLSAGDTYAGGAVGGAAEHTLTVDEMPSHIHEIIISEGDVTTHEVVANAILKSSLDSSVYEYRSATNKSMMESGNSQPHNNMPPYLAVYVWKRTA